MTVEGAGGNDTPPPSFPNAFIGNLDEAQRVGGIWEVGIPVHGFPLRACGNDWWQGAGMTRPPQSFPNAFIGNLDEAKRGGMWQGGMPVDGFPLGACGNDSAGSVRE